MTRVIQNILVIHILLCLFINNVITSGINGTEEAPLWLVKVPIDSRVILSCYDPSRFPFNELSSSPLNGTEANSLDSDPVWLLPENQVFGGNRTVIPGWTDQGYRSVSQNGVLFIIDRMNEDLAGVYWCGVRNPNATEGGWMYRSVAVNIFGPQLANNWEKNKYRAANGLSASAILGLGSLSVYLLYLFRYVEKRVGVTANDDRAQEQDKTIYENEAYVPHVQEFNVKGDSQRHRQISLASNGIETCAL